MTWVFAGLGSFLIRDDASKIAKGRVGLILMGNLVQRAEHAAGLWHDGIVETLVFFEAESGILQKKGWVPSDARLTRMVLTERGVPSSSILHIVGETISTSTQEEARNFRAWLLEQPDVAKEVVVVTSWYHTSRAGWIFDKVFADQEFIVKMSPAPTPGVQPEHWWQNERSFLYVFEEYLKWAYYLYRYS